MAWLLKHVLVVNVPHVSSILCELAARNVVLYAKLARDLQQTGRESVDR
jgi:hypothetical protein